MIRENRVETPGGLAMLLLLILTLILLIYALVSTGQSFESGPGKVFAIMALLFLCVVDLLLMTGLFSVEPNQGVVLTLFGKYRGTERGPGLHWTNPFLAKKRISLRVRNFETAKLKVNDHDGNPIEIGSVVVWQVVDTAEACFEVDNYDNYVHVQSESALRSLATCAGTTSRARPYGSR